MKRAGLFLMVSIIIIIRRRNAYKASFKIEFVKIHARINAFRKLRRNGWILSSLMYLLGFIWAVKPFISQDRISGSVQSTAQIVQYDDIEVAFRTDNVIILQAIGFLGGQMHRRTITS